MISKSMPLKFCGLREHSPPWTMLICCWMVSLENLQGPFNTLDKAKERSHDQRSPSKQHRVACKAVPSIKPPLRPCLRGRLIESLLENNYPVAPVIERVYLTIFSSEPAKLNQSRVKLGSLSFLPEPSGSGGIPSGKEQSNSSHRLFYKAIWKQLTGPS